MALSDTAGYLLLLAVVLLGLSVGAMVYRAKRRRARAMLQLAVLTLAWIGWGFTALALQPAKATGYASMVVIAAIVAVAILAVPVAMVQVGSADVSARRPLGLAAAVGMLLFLLPYLLWSQGAIPFYNTATLYALALVAARCSPGTDTFNALRKCLRPRPAIVVVTTALYNRCAALRECVAPAALLDDVACRESGLRGEVTAHSPALDRRAAYKNR